MTDDPHRESPAGHSTDRAAMLPADREAFLRRRFLAAATATTVATAIGSAQAADQGWATFKSRFVDPAGRIIDTGNKDVSHSEGQGWGLLFAESAEDRPEFDRIWAWTARTLRRPDELFAWRWVPWGETRVPDLNNASDGDILIAWALQRAARRWNVRAFESASRAIQAAILSRLCIDLGPYFSLLPGIDSFRRDQHAIVNLSYYVWPALRDFSKGDVQPMRWSRLEQDGLKLLDRAAFGALKLPPDWLLAGPDRVEIASGWPPRFGYDAIRIPLYLAWANDKARLRRFVAAWQSARVGSRPAAWIDLRSGALADYVADGGYEAVDRLVAATVRGDDANVQSLPVLDAGDTYYAASLKLLAGLAAREAATRR